MLTSCLEKLRLDILCTGGDLEGTMESFLSVFFLPSSKVDLILCLCPPPPVSLSPVSPWSWSLGRPGCSYFQLTETFSLRFVLWGPQAERVSFRKIQVQPGNSISSLGLRLLPQRDLPSAWQLPLRNYIHPFRLDKGRLRFHSAHLPKSRTT